MYQEPKNNPFQIYLDISASEKLKSVNYYRFLMSLVTTLLNEKT